METEAGSVDYNSSNGLSRFSSSEFGSNWLDDTLVALTPRTDIFTPQTPHEDSFTLHTPREAIKNQALAVSVGLGVDSSSSIDEPGTPPTLAVSTEEDRCTHSARACMRVV